jgi:hypothetical protein
VKKFIVNLLYKAVGLIEKYQHRKLDLDEDDISKKIIEEYDLDLVDVLSDTGWVKASQIYRTQPYTHHKIILEDDTELECADIHILFTSDLKEVNAIDVNVGDRLYTIDGPKVVKKIERLDRKLSMYDLSIDHENHRYYTNGILSHNTINAAIYILHFVTFHADKNVMIAANKGDTVIEIVDKIKNIYKQLPFFLKAGITNWNQKNIIFGDTGCRIKSTARSKEPAIGFTIDFLYLDEFAHIPRNIIEPYYRAIYPTVSAIENSKIIITSTPNGPNLFQRLLVNAERPEGDHLKNTFNAMRVYWDQVPGRHMTFVRLHPAKLKKYGILAEDVYDLCKKEWDPDNKTDINKIPYVALKYDDEKEMETVRILNRPEVSTEDVRKFTFENKKGVKLKLAMLGEVTSWKEEAIKNIGGEEAFNQEYNLQFITGSKLLFDKHLLKLFASRQVKFKHIEFDHFDDRLSCEYKELEFIDDTSIFDIEKAKDYHIVMSIDTGEGIGEDYTVINIFKLVHKTEKEIEDNTYGTIYDYFRLEQVGIYRCNLMGTPEVAEILYMTAFELFDPEKVKIVIELNGAGGELLANMNNVFDGNHDYGNFVFSRFKHRAADKKRKVGMKVNRNKGTTIKEYQKRMKNGDLFIHHEITLNEIRSFIKEKTDAGNLKFFAEVGNDDAVMTVVNLSRFFGTVDWKNMIETYMSYDLEERIRVMIERKVEENEYVEAADYSSLSSLRNKQLPPKRNTRNLPPPRKGFRS